MDVSKELVKLCHVDVVVFVLSNRRHENFSHELAVSPPLVVIAYPLPVEEILGILDSNRLEELARCDKAVAIQISLGDDFVDVITESTIELIVSHLKPVVVLLIIPHRAIDDVCEKFTKLMLSKAS